MSNGSNLPRYTWQEAIDAVASDKEFNDTVLEAVKAPEVGPRAPVVLYHRWKADIGEMGLDCLPEPGSDQEKRTNGLYFRLSEGDANDRDTDPRRYWDKYKYQISTGETVEGSVYMDMVDRHPYGITLNEAIKVIDDWNNKDIDHASIPASIYIDGVEENIRDMAETQRDNRRAMLASRKTRFANNMRRTVDIHRNIKAIKANFAKIVTIGFVYNKEHTPSSGIARVTETIRVIKLITDPNAVDNDGNSKLGQESSVHCSFTANQFINLSPDEVLKKPEKEQTYDALINSKRVKAARAKKGQGKSTTTDNAESAATTGNLPATFSNIRLFAENENAVKLIYQKINSMKADQRPEYITDLLETRDFLIKACLPEWEQVRKDYVSVATKKQRDELAAKLNSEAQTREAEQQPTQNQRLNADADAALKAPSEPVSKTEPAKSNKSTAARSNKQRAG